MSTSANKSYAVSMLEDVILLDIDGVVSGWDSYTFNLNIASPGTKVSLDLFDSCQHVN
jgi:hypothetical protein